jgi:hypothetical protein
MRQLVYLVAFGPECLEQFNVCYKGLKKCDIDIALITDQNYNEEKVSVIRVEPVLNAREQYAFRTGFRDYIPIEDYDRVWYMDCDFLIFKDIFTYHSLADGILLSNEPKLTAGNPCFSGDMTDHERGVNFYGPAINAGIYSVPKKYFHWFAMYDHLVKGLMSRNLHINIPEQMVLNSIYVRYQGNFLMELMEGVGFPEKGVTGQEMAYHYACYQFKDKLDLMWRDWRGRKQT